MQVPKLEDRAAGEASGACIALPRARRPPGRAWPPSRDLPRCGMPQALDPHMLGSIKGGPAAGSAPPSPATSPASPSPAARATWRGPAGPAPSSWLGVLSAGRGGGRGGYAGRGGPPPRGRRRAGWAAAAGGEEASRGRLFAQRWLPGTRKRGDDAGPRSQRRARRAPGSLLRAALTAQGSLPASTHRLLAAFQCARGPPTYRRRNEASVEAALHLGLHRS